MNVGTLGEAGAGSTSGLIAERLVEKELDAIDLAGQDDLSGVCFTMNRIS